MWNSNPPIRYTRTAKNWYDADASCCSWTCVRIPLGIGVIVSAFMVGLREDRRAIHDFVAGTEVVWDLIEDYKELLYRGKNHVQLLNH